jgi:hypothetical protein
VEAAAPVAVAVKVPVEAEAKGAAEVTAAEVLRERDEVPVWAKAAEVAGIDLSTQRRPVNRMRMCRALEVSRRN